MEFTRIHNDPRTEIPLSTVNDKALDDHGYLWRRGLANWHIERKIVPDGGKLLDVQAEPTIREGKVYDVAVTPMGKCWGKLKNGWAYEGSLGDETLAEIRTERLVVLGNITLPIVDGAVPLFSGDKIVGVLRVFPVKRLT